jgi:hypothetical protein
MINELSLVTLLLYRMVTLADKTSIKATTLESYFLKVGDKMDQQCFDHPLFLHPFTSILAGPSKSGKTEFAKKFIKNLDHLVCPVPEQVLWCYSEWQPTYFEFMKNPKVKLIEGLPDLGQLKATSNIPKLLVMDDLMTQIDGKKQGLTDLFTRGAHHWNCSCLHIVQNLYYGTIRTARINSHYLILMRNPSDKLQASMLAKQLYPGQQASFLGAYKEACSKPYGYLVIDVAPDTQEELRLRTNIFPEDKYTIVYLPKV